MRPVIRRWIPNHGMALRLAASHQRPPFLDSRLPRVRWGRARVTSVARRESEGKAVVVVVADSVTDFFYRRAKVILLTIFTYAALC